MAQNTSVTSAEPQRKQGKPLTRKTRARWRWGGKWLLQGLTAQITLVVTGDRGTDPWSCRQGSWGPRWVSAPGAPHASTRKPTFEEASPPEGGD